ncbi:MAG: aldo/keto reductase [Steroidobacteraceae bacterium]
MRRREWLRLALASAATVVGRDGYAHQGSNGDHEHSPDENQHLLIRRIPSSGEGIPVIGLGTSGPFEVGDDDTVRRQLVEVLETFFVGGGMLIDTSPMYSTAQAVLGDLLTEAMQARAFLATKVWTRGHDQGVAQMSESMRLLRRKRIELMQVHNLLDLDTQLATLAEWKAKGRVRYVGITHYTVASQDQLAEVISRHQVDFVQTNYSAFTPDAARRLLPLAADRGVAVLVNRAFEDGKVFARLRQQPLPGFAADIDCTSWAQLLLKYVISHPAVTCVIPATGKASHMKDNLAAGRGAMPGRRLRKQIADAVRA